MKHLEKIEKNYEEPEYIFCMISNGKYGAIIEALGDSYKILNEFPSVYPTVNFSENKLIASMRTDLLLFKLDNDEIGSHIILQKI